MGHVTLPVIGYYCSSKWAFEAIYESLAEEVKPFGIKVTIIEPGAYATEFGQPVVKVCHRYGYLYQFKDQLC
ncbi:SDR family NAD(P)-dependent oxidoreductase [Niabella defluvii]|nr:SDR family NAD(P)-dependent oxidoreductase [Niabella sp. I65]